MKTIMITCDLCGKEIHKGSYCNTMTKIADEDLKDITKNCESYIYNGVGHAMTDLCLDCLTKFSMKESGSDNMREM